MTPHKANPQKHWYNAEIQFQLREILSKVALFYERIMSKKIIMNAKDAFFSNIF